MPNWGAAGTGALSGAAAGSVIPVLGTGAGALIGGALGLFGGGDKDKVATKDAAVGADSEISDLIKSLREKSEGNSGKADRLSAMGDDALRPVLDYFSKIIGGDQGAVMEATRPERARVIDQYDAARKTISEFSPRGGGTNAALASSSFDQASDLSNITASARSNAINAAGSLGTQLEGLGLTADQLESADINTIVNAILSRRGLDLQEAGMDLAESGQNKALAGDLAEGLGTLLGMYLTRGKKP